MTRILSLAIFCALVFVVPLVAIPYGTVDPAWEALFECVIFGLAILWIFDGLGSRRWLCPEHRLMRPVLILIAFGFFQTITLVASEGKGWQTISADPYGTRLVMIKLIAYALFLTLLLLYTKSTRRLRVLVFLVIGIAVASSLFGMVRQAIQDQPGFVLPRLMPNTGYAQFINYNHFAYLMEMGLGLSIGLIASRTTRLELKTVYVALCLVMAGGLVLSNSRGGILSFLCQLVLMIILIFSQSVRRRQQFRAIKPNLSRFGQPPFARLIVALFMAILVLVGIWWIGGDRLATKISATDEFSSAGRTGRDHVRRREIWRETWQVIKANPVAGVGFGGYWVAIDEYHDASGQFKPYQAHNDYLDLLASGGLIGTAIAGWLAFEVLKQCREQLATEDSFRRAVCFGALVGLLGVAVHSLVDFGLQTTINALVFMVLIVIASVRINSTGDLRGGVLSHLQIKPTKVDSR